MPNYVPGYGCSTAKLLVLGEAPGQREDEAQKPFVGPAGQLLDEILTSSGTTRDQVYITNVVKYRPPDNDISRFHSLGIGSIEDQLPSLFEEIEAINPNCILALGETALKALTGLKGITKYRGSILSSPKTGRKLVATIHPAALLSHGDTQLPWKNLAWIKTDTKRAVEQANFPEINRPYRNLKIARGSLDVIRFLESNIDKSNFTKAAIDVETHKTYAQCVGIAFDSTSALCIPTFDTRIETHELAQMWKYLYEFFQDVNIGLIAQNSKFDEKRCRQLGLTWRDLYFDIPMAWHCLYSEFPKKLAFLTSILTEEPYYKDEGEEINPKDIDKWFYYNCKDAVCEFEVYEKVHAMLVETGMEEFYWKIHEFHRLYSELEDTGIKFDRSVNEHLYKKYSTLLDSKRQILLQQIQSVHPEVPNFSYQIRSKKEKKIKEVAIANMNVASHQQVAAVLYGYLGCPLRKDTGSDTLKGLSNNAVKDTRIKSIIQGIIEDRKISKTIGTYINAKPSHDGRIRTQVNINGTASGRTSNNNLEPPVSISKEGLALQTMTKHEDATAEDAGGGDLRSEFIADKHFVLFEADLSGAEDHVVCTLAEDWEGLAQLNRKKFLYNQHGLKDDRHTQTAMLTCSLDFESVTDYYRQIGKKDRHAGNYDMGKGEFMRQLAGSGIFVSEWKCGKMLDIFHAANPKIRGVFHKAVIEALGRDNCILKTPHGRREQFFERWGNDLFKKAFSFIPQATVSDSVKFAMVRIKHRIDSISTGLFYYLQESHDSFLALCHTSIVALAGKIIKEEMSRPIDFNLCSIPRNHILVIPSDIKIGLRWIEKSPEFPDGMRKYKEGISLEFNK